MARTKTVIDRPLPAEAKTPYTRDRGVLLSTNEAALHLGVTGRLMRRLVEDGQLPVVKVRRLNRFHIDDLDAYIAARRKAAQ